MKACRILLADDHQVVLDGLRTLFAKRQVQIVGEARDGERTVALAVELQPDVVIMDISMPRMSGIEAAEEIARLCPGTRTIIYTMHSDQRFLLSMFRAGVAGIVLKEDDPHELLSAVDIVLGGGIAYGRHVPQEWVQQLLRAQPDPTEAERLRTLSAREMGVLQLLADGVSVKNVAVRLCISHKTVETHKHNIFKKLGIDSMAMLIRLAIRQGIVRG